MRKSIAVAAFLIALSAPASATDLGGGGYALGERAVQVVVYDYQPGVIVRPYWAPPWQNRRYFPVTGRIPESGRHENLNAPRRRHVPAQGYYREWSTSSVFQMPVADFSQMTPLAAAPSAVEPAVPNSNAPQQRFEPIEPQPK